jgi:hypothetical protein
VIDLCLLFYLVAKSFRLQPSHLLSKLLKDPLGRPLLILSTLWTLIYFIFLFVWLPQNTFYRLFYLPALVLLIGLFAWIRYPRDQYHPGYRLATLTIAMAIANFLFFIFPYSHAEKFPPTRFALEMNEQWRDKAVVYYDLENSDNHLVRYFAPSTRWIQLRQSEIPITDLDSKYSEGWTVWLETTAIDRLSSTPEGAEWLKAHERTRRSLEDKAFRIEFVQVLP